MIDENKLVGEISEEIKCMNKEKDNYFKGGNFHNGNLMVEKISAIKIIKNIINSQPKIGEWISCSERLPEEHESIFAKFKGTDKWNDAMFEKISDEVNVTVEFEDGTRKTKTLHTIDGRWNGGNRGIKFKVIAWQPLPEPYNPDRSIP